MGTSRSKSVWVRFATVVVLIVVGGLSLRHTLVNIAMRADPERALTLSSGHGLVQARVALVKLSEGEPSVIAQSRSLAKSALRSEPTAIDAVTVLGTVAQIDGDTTAANRAFQYAARLSNRNLQTHLWAIQKAVDEGNADLALRHYDLALRTSGEAAPLLLPTLGNIVSEPSLYQAVTRVAKDAPWRRQFLIQVARNTGTTRDALRFFAAAQADGMTIERDVTGALLRTLFDRGDANASWQLYRSIRPDARPLRSRDPTFALAPEQVTPFDWAVPAASESYSQIGINESGQGRVIVDLPPGGAGVLLQQAQVLPPGNYRLVVDGTQDFSGAGQERRLWWQLRCVGGANVMDSGLKFTGTPVVSFKIGSECPAQVLELHGKQPDGSGDLAAEILRAEIIPG